MSAQRSAVWIDDPHVIFRRGLAASLASEGFEVAGESASFSPEPDLDGVAVLLFDIEGSGLEAAVEVARGSVAKLVGMARTASEQTLREGVQAGLSGFVVRSDLTPASLAGCLVAVAGGHGSLPPDLTARLIGTMSRESSSAASPDSLAARELRVLELLAEGRDTRGIASELSYSERTVKNIVHDLLVKTNCRTRAQAVAVATRRGFI
jgi:DNA-binding NarL/FixJ family response regulator